MINITISCCLFINLGLTDSECDDYSNTYLQTLKDKEMAKSLQQNEDAKFAKVLGKKYEVDDFALFFITILTRRFLFEFIYLLPQSKQIPAPFIFMIISIIVLSTCI